MTGFVPRPVARVHQGAEPPGAEDAAKPKFEGIPNSIRFRTRESFQRDPIGCLGIPGLRAEYADPETARGTELDIVLTYPSSTLKPDRAWASTCAGELVVLDVPRDRLTEGTIGGRPAVFVKSVSPVFTLFRIYIAEPFGLIRLGGEPPMTLEELEKIAEGLK